MSGQLSKLNSKERRELIKSLHRRQNGMCFISEKPIDLGLHYDELDIDHVVPSRDKGPDNETNYALTFSTYNRSKQAADLNVARVLVRFEKIKNAVTDQLTGVNLSHVLNAHGGSKHSLNFKSENSQFIYSLSKSGGEETLSVPILHDKLANVESVYLELPIEYLFHDDEINPRGIGANLRKLIEEFYKKRPQLHAPLAWIETTADGSSKVKIFDGQHKAAAQILLAIKHIPIRLFLDPDKEVILRANTNAGTTLRQVAFDKATQRSLGSSILVKRLDQFRSDKNFKDDQWNFSEQDLVDHFKGDQRSMKKFVIDRQRANVFHSPDLKLREYIEAGGKSTQKPFSYSAIEKAIFSQFIGGSLLATPWDFKEDQGLNPRQLEISQLVKLLNIIADEIYIERYDFELGIGKLEAKINAEEPIPEDHFVSARMAREEILHTWASHLKDIINQYCVSNGMAFEQDKPLQRELPEQVWVNLRNFIKNLRNLPLWRDKTLASTAFGGKRNYEYWRSVFDTGEAPDGTQILPSGGLNKNKLEMIKG